MSIFKKNVAAAVLFAAVIVIIGMFMFYAEPQYGLNQITRNDLESLLESPMDEDHFVYVGRDTCPDCQEFAPILQNTLKVSGEYLDYYCTECLSSEKKEMRDYINSIGIYEVPAIIRISSDETTILDMQKDEDIQTFISEFTKES